MHFKRAPFQYVFSIRLFNMSFQYVFSKHLFKTSLQNIFSKHLFKTSFQNIFAKHPFTQLYICNRIYRPFGLVLLLKVTLVPEIAKAKYLVTLKISVMDVKTDIQMDWQTFAFLELLSQMINDIIFVTMTVSGHDGKARRKGSFLISL